MEEGKDECGCGRFVDVVTEIPRFSKKCESSTFNKPLVMYCVPGLRGTGAAGG